MADNLLIDVNRERVISRDYLPFIVMQLQTDSLADFAIPVLFNICVDYGKCRLVMTR